jgi:hypothetical protein
VKRQDNPGGRFSEAFRSIHEMYHAILLYFDAFGAQPFICRYSISSTNNGLHHWNSHLFCPHIRLDDDACMRHVNECSVFFPADDLLRKLNDTPMELYTTGACMYATRTSTNQERVRCPRWTYWNVRDTPNRLLP